MTLTFDLGCVPLCMCFSSSCKSCHWGDNGDQTSSNERENPNKRYSRAEHILSSPSSAFPHPTTVSFCSFITLSTVVAFFRVFCCTSLLHLIVFFFPKVEERPEEKPTPASPQRGTDKLLMLTRKCLLITFLASFVFTVISTILCVCLIFYFLNLFNVAWPSLNLTAHLQSLKPESKWRKRFLWFQSQKRMFLFPEVGIPTNFFRTSLLRTICCLIWLLYVWIFP